MAPVLIKVFLFIGFLSYDEVLYELGTSGQVDVSLIQYTFLENHKYFSPS